MKKDFEKIQAIINGETGVIVFGAGYLGKMIIHYLQGISEKIRFIGIAVTNTEENPNLVSGIRVCLLEEFRQYFAFATVVVAVSELYWQEIMSVLTKYGFNNVVLLTPQIEWYLHKRFQYSVFPRGAINDKILEEEFQQGKEGLGDNLSLFKIYEAKSDADHLIGTELAKEAWIETIQAGADLAKRELAELKDNVGKNISKKNRQYCELTVLYWLWKNCENSYWGICHYRRKFSLTLKMINTIFSKDIDVVLPVPTMLNMSLEQHYFECHGREKWNIMKEVLNEKYPEYKDSAEKVFKGNIFYEYNMVIGKKCVMDRYCNWLFGILAEVEERCGKEEDTYQNRYIGFIGERLLTLYFFYHRDEYHIVHAWVEKIF